MTQLLSLSNVGFRFAERLLLEHITFHLEKGSCTALVGPNGAGKTTLLRIISGALVPTCGEVLFEGRALRAWGARQRAQSIALVPQQLEMSFDFSVQQIVEQGRTPYLGMLRGPMRKDRAAIDRALDLTDTFTLRDRIFNELSGGERQRVKIALGLAQEPALLLLDEPTQNLDIGRQVELIDLLHVLRDEGITILSSIHDLHLVPGNFSAALLLAPGRSLIMGKPEDVLRPELLASAFHCSPGRHPMLREEFREWPVHHSKRPA